MKKLLLLSLFTISISLFSCNKEELPKYDKCYIFDYYGYTLGVNTCIPCLKKITYDANGPKYLLYVADKQEVHTWFEVTKQVYDNVKTGDTFCR